ncbi:alpha/beta fold hydrolase [Ktedonobacter racemifer]|uniref:Alpha/beta hydrolase fold protein n=1 Tax=Ktedonobacter racemifer DSM 44963 TaxID=485913 RepID=D6U2N5_KTERA|nr:alpha/beta fold hydrolase [Ktedonobacter racemifer]EFH80999.1 alpha/beta hydrolase fold protein [Ktedonobacter racemifer DSM 44963]
MPFVTVPDGTRLYYETAGEGEPLLLISGSGLDHTFWNWNDVRDDFVSRYRVIVYDHRGTGQSDKPDAPPYSTRRLAQDAVWLLDHLGIERAHVYGNSMGGMIGQWVAIDHGKRVGALVLGATTPGPMFREQRDASNAHSVPRTAKINAIWTNPPANRQEALEKVALTLSPAWVTTHPDAFKEIFPVPPIPHYASKFFAQATREHDAWDLLPTISTPTLVIHGSEDLVAPTANASLLAERIPGAELSLIKGGRHVYHVEFREEASRVVNEFLARHPLE